jgi:hypothetical protein
MTNLTCEGLVWNKERHTIKPQNLCLQIPDVLHLARNIPCLCARAHTHTTTIKIVV